MKKEIRDSKLRNISCDFLLNLIASFLVTGISQIVLYPTIAYYVASEEYGVILTLMGVANTVAAALGGSLNNTRLLLASDIDDIGKDFQCINFGTCVISVLSTVLIFNYIYSQKIIVTVMLVTFTVLCMLRTYLCVEYRITLNYKKILFSNVCVTAGNLIGVVLFIVLHESHMWVLPFLLGEIAGFLYILFTTRILKERIGITQYFRQIFSKYLILLITSLTANFLTYLDRLLLLPLLGGEAVSVYTIASVFGKSLGILMTPLAGVMLSYYSQKGFTMNKKIFWRINIGTVVVGIVFIVASILFAPWLTRFIYPSFVEAVDNYMIIANVTAIINIMANMTQPSVLKFAPTSWQLIIQLVYCILYLGVGVFASNRYGLWGFSVAALSTAIIKLLFLYLVGHVFIGESR